MIELLKVAFIVGCPCITVIVCLVAYLATQRTGDEDEP